MRTIPWGASSIAKQDDFTDLWTSVGLTPSEIEAYEFLLDHAGSTATGVAKATRRSRGRTYQTLRALVERGLVRERPSEPVEYAPVEPAEIIQLLLAASHRRGAELETLLEKARQWHPTPPAARPPQEAPQAALLRGRRPVSAEILRLVDGASRRLWVSGGGNLVARIRAQRSLVIALQAAADRGVDVAIAAAPADPAAPPTNPFPGLAGVRFATLAWGSPIPVNLLASDATALLIVPLPDDDAPGHGDDFCVRLEGSPLAEAVATWVDAMVRGSQGPAAGETDAAARAEWLSSVRTARTRILVMGAKPWLALATAEDAGLRQAHLEAVRRGVDVRFVTDLDPSVWRLVQPLLSSCRVRATQAVPVWAAVVDDRICFVGIAGHSDEVSWIRRSTDSQDVRHVSGLFTRFWDAGADLAA